MEAGFEGDFAFVTGEVGDLIGDLVPGTANQKISIFFPLTPRNLAAKTCHEDLRYLKNGN